MQQPPNPYLHYPQQQWSQPNQFSRVFPSWEDISQFKQPLTDDEWYLLKFLDDHLKRLEKVLIKILATKFPVIGDGALSKDKLD